MFIRTMVCGVVAVGAMMFGAGCGGTAEAREEVEVRQQNVGEFCGGFAGIQCPAGLVCVDDPNDSCDPRNGGADCAGICQEDKKNKCKDPDRDYVSKDPEVCATIRFFCPEGQVAFFDDCGCGCEPAP